MSRLQEMTLKHQYSGKLSKEFWYKIDSLSDSDQQELYTLGVELQNLESKVLRKLENAKPGSVNL